MRQKPLALVLLVGLLVSEDGAVLLTASLPRTIKEIERIMVEVRRVHGDQ